MRSEPNEDPDGTVTESVRTAEKLLYKVKQLPSCQLWDGCYSARDRRQNLRLNRKTHKEQKSFSTPVQLFKGSDSESPACVGKLCAISLDTF